MCGGQPKIDTSVQDQMLADSKKARADEEARKARIEAGTGKIDATFGQFDQPFYKNFRDKFVGYYQPEVDKQFGNAQDALTFALARAGTLNSSIAGQKQGELNSAYDVNRASVLSQAEDATAGLKGSVNNEKSSLISLLNATGDADRASNEALARSQQLFEKQPSYNPLGDIFAGVASGIGNYYGGQQNANALKTYFAGSNPAKGSYRLVN